MRHSIYKVATVVAGIFMSCALPFSTRANLGSAHKVNVVHGQTNFEMPAEEYIRFITFPRVVDPVQARIGLSVEASLEAFVLTRGPTEPQWPSATVHEMLPLASAQRFQSTRQITVDATPPASAENLSLPRQLGANVDRINIDSPVLAPIAFVRFCMRYPEDCKIRGAQPGEEPMMLTNEQKAGLEKVNREVNRKIAPQENTRGVAAEEWLVAPRRGDCNDYAVTKRHELLARGWPSNSLLLAEVVVAAGEHHLVLVVRTRDEDLVLDNLSRTILPVSQIPYRWVRAQQPQNPKFWSTVNVVRADRVAMDVR